MQFEWKKTENCFAGSRSYDYRLPLPVRSFKTCLVGWVIEENHSYRRPVLTARKAGLILRGILDRHVIKVSFPETSWQADKAVFDDWLAGLEVDDHA